MTATLDPKNARTPGTPATPQRGANDAAASPDWGPCCVCDKKDAQITGRGQHENNHAGCDVCIDCVNLNHDGSPVTGR